MLKCIKKLLTGEKTCCGNHHVAIVNGKECFFYHSTIICEVDHTNKIVTLNDGGWDTRSTNRAIHSYAPHFQAKGYLINDIRDIPERRKIC